MPGASLEAWAIGTACFPCLSRPWPWPCRTRASPTNVNGSRLAPSGKLAAFALPGPVIELREIPSGRQLAHFSVTNGDLWALCLDTTSDELFAVVGPVISNRTQSLPERRICTWAADIEGHWRETENCTVP